MKPDKYYMKLLKTITGNNGESEEDDDKIDSEVDGGNDLMISDGGNASTTSGTNVVTEYLPIQKAKSVVCQDLL